MPPLTSASAATPLADLLTLLDLQSSSPTTFAGSSPANGWKRVYGGQVLAQAYIAASRTVAVARPFNSLHAYFLLGGDPDVSIDYAVETLRDGGSFSTRRVTALQAGVPIFAMMASFHKSEAGFEHARPMGDVPPPEAVPPIGELFARPDAQIFETMRAYYARPRPIDLRLIDSERYFGGQALPARQRFWLRTHDALPDDPALHTAILAYASDFAMIDTALIPHGRVMFDPAMQLASLDHGFWLHRPFRADTWLLYELESPTTGGGRSFTRGTFFDREGRLVASVVQEGLVRERSTSFAIK